MINRFGPPFARGPQFVYGDSYGGVAQNELAQDASRDSRYYQGLGAQRANRALDFQDQQAEAGNQLAWQQLIQQAAEAARRNQLDQSREQLLRDQMGQNNTQFVDKLALDKQAQDSLDAYHRGTLDINRAKEAAFDTPEAKSAPLFAEGMQLAQGGYGDRSNLDLATLYPGLSPNQLARIQAVINSRRAGVEANDEAGVNQAQILNDRLTNIKRANLSKLLTANPPTKWFGMRNDPDALSRSLLEVNAGQRDAELAPIPPADPNFQKFMLDLGKNPKMANIVQYDEDKQQVLPVRRPLPTLTSPSAALGPAEEAPRDPALRKLDTIYVTPRGLMKWTTGGWFPP